jgi:hypothetical protein
LETEDLTLDILFGMVNSELEQLLAKCCIETVEGKKLLGALDHLTTYYSKLLYLVNKGVSQLRCHEENYSRGTGYAGLA